MYGLADGIGSQNPIFLLPTPLHAVCMQGEVGSQEPRERVLTKVNSYTVTPQMHTLLSSSFTVVAFYLPFMTFLSGVHRLFSCPSPHCHPVYLPYTEIIASTEKEHQ